MDVFMYGCDVKEETHVVQCRSELGLEIATTPYKATMDNVHLCKGCSCISVLSTPLSGNLIEKMQEQGVRFISTRTIGYDHIDLETCARLGIQVSNVTYSPESVADYAIMLMLMSLRKMKLIMKSAELQDYSFAHVEGRNLKGRYVGVIGTGHIGTVLIQHLHGFGCHILAYSPHPKKELEDMVRYVDLDTLYQMSDVITLHLPLTDAARHMINHETIRKMKDGVVIINTARGALIDNEALIDGILSKKIGAAALDVVEHETGIYYNNRKGSILAPRDMAVLNSFPNVIMSPHMAFLSEESTHDMVVHSMQDCQRFLDGKEPSHRII